MSVDERICTVCLKTKLVFEFYKKPIKGNADKIGISQYSSVCKKCISIAAKEKAAKRREAGIVAEQKVCAKCKVLKLSDAFNKSSHTSDGLTSRCCDCQKEERDEKVKKLREVAYIADRKVCFTCKIDKPASEFCANKNVPDGLKSECKECASSRRKTILEKRKANAVIPETKVCFECKEEKSKDDFSL